MNTTTTKRITEAPTSSSAKRVDSNGATPTIFGDTWGGTWGSTWGYTWNNITMAVRALPEVNATQRNTEAPTSSITKRVTGI